MPTHPSRPVHSSLARAASARLEQPRPRRLPPTGLLALFVLPCVLVVAACASDDPDECHDEISCEELDAKEEEAELAYVRGDAGDAGRDAGRNAGRDAGQNVGRDAGQNAGQDAGRDASAPSWPWPWPF